MLIIENAFLLGLFMQSGLVAAVIGAFWAMRGGSFSSAFFAVAIPLCGAVSVLSMLGVIPQDLTHVFDDNGSTGVWLEDDSHLAEVVR